MSFTDVLTVKYSLMELQAVPRGVNLPMHKELKRLKTGLVMFL